MLVVTGGTRLRGWIFGKLLQQFLLIGREVFPSRLRGGLGSKDPLHGFQGKGVIAHGALQRGQQVFPAIESP